MPANARHARWLAAALILGAAGPASAQPAQPPNAAHLRLFEAGGGVLTLAAEGVAALPAAMVRVNLSQHWSADVVVAARHGLPRGGYHGTYIIQAHYAGAPSRRVRPFVTMGGAGFFDKIPNRRQMKRFELPRAVIGGGGAQVRLLSRMLFESGVQLWVGDEAGAFAWHNLITVPFGPLKRH
jgi:hypothetical protein